MSVNKKLAELQAMMTTYENLIVDLRELFKSDDGKIDEEEQKKLDTVQEYVTNIKKKLLGALNGSSDNGTTPNNDSSDSDTASNDTTPDNNTPPKPTPKAIQGSVGKGGVNNSIDVRLVQELLVKKGISVSVDGQIGPQTIGAIEQFQRSIFNGWSDGIIDAGGTTWKTLSGNTPQTSPNNEQLGPIGNQLQTVSGVIMSIPPNADTGTYPLVVIFGGIKYATAQWMMAKTPQSYFKDALLVFASYQHSFAGVQNIYLPYFNQKGLQISSTSIAGFSAGGLPVQAAYKGSFKGVGLIDPSTRSTYTRLGFSSNTILCYNPYNWTGLPAIHSLFPALAAKVESGGGIVENIPKGHADFPAYFFSKYKGKLI